MTRHVLPFIFRISAWLASLLNTNVAERTDDGTVRRFDRRVQHECRCVATHTIERCVDPVGSRPALLIAACGCCCAVQKTSSEVRASRARTTSL